MEILPLYPDLDTPGLLNSTLYDTIPILEGAAGEVAINASQFQVDCGAVQNGGIDGYATRLSDTGLTLDVFFNDVSIGNSALSVGELPAGVFIFFL